MCSSLVKTIIFIEARFICALQHMFRFKVEMNMCEMKFFVSFFLRLLLMCLLWLWTQNHERTQRALNLNIFLINANIILRTLTIWPIAATSSHSSHASVTAITHIIRITFICCVMKIIFIFLICHMLFNGFGVCVFAKYNAQLSIFN